MDIVSFREKYPAYDAIPDAELADKLYTKHYAGRIERSEFDSKFLGVEQKGMIGKAVDSVAGAVQGSAEFPDLPYAQQGAWGIGRDSGMKVNNFRVAAASIFGDDDDYAQALLDKNPGHTLEHDSGGNAYLAKDGQPVSYVQKPGLGVEDVTRVAGKIGAFTPATMLTSGVAKGVAGRVAVGAASAGATDASMQVAAKNSTDIDTGQVAMNAAVGGAGEALAPIVGKVVQSLKDKRGAKAWNNLSQKRKDRLVVAQLKRDGFDVDDLRGMGRENAQALGRERIVSGELVSPESSIASSEFGYRATKGQQMADATDTQRAAKFDQLSKEEQLKSTPSGQRFRDIDHSNSRQTDQNIESIAGGFSGGEAQASTAMEGAQLVQSGLQNAERSLKSKVDAAYNNARGHDANLAGDFFDEMPNRMMQALEESDVILDELTPAARNAMQGFAEAIEKTKGAGDVPIQHVERQRRLIARRYDAALNNEDRRAVQIIKNTYDDLLDEAIDTKLFIGDDGALDALKDARKLHAEYSRKFRSKDEAGKAVQKMLDIDATPEQVANYMIGVNGLSKAGSARVAKAYASIVGKDSAEYDALREMAFLTIARKPTGDAKGSQALVSTLKKAVNGQGSSLMNELYSKSEIATLKRFTKALEATLPYNADFARTSGTAERLQRFYNSTGFRSLPFMDSMKGIMEHYQVNAALLPPRQINPVNASPAAAAAIAVDDDE